MAVSPHVEAEIVRLYYAEHFKVGTIAGQLQVHPDVVCRVLGLEPKSPPAAAASGTPPKSVQPYAGFIHEVLSRYQGLRSTRVYDMLVERGYRGSPRSVRRFVQAVRPAPTQAAYLRTESLVGEQAQVDWAHVGPVQVPGGQRALWVFVMVLAYSRAMWAELVFDLSIHSLLRSLVRACSYLGGCPRQFLFDNPKIVVLERHHDAARFHPLLVQLSGALRVQLRLCDVRAPQQKGKVERAVRYLRDRFLAGRQIGDIATGNAQLLQFLEQIAGPRPHPVQPGQCVQEVLAQERPHLLSLPDPLPPTDLVKPVGVDKTAFVILDTNHYSVPSQYAQQTLTLVACDRRVRLLDKQVLVAQHERSYGRGQFLEDPAHRQQLLEQRQAARAPKGRDRLRQAVPDIDHLFARWVQAGRNVGNLTLRTLKLLDLYGDTLLAQAVAQALARGTSDIGALAVLCEQQRRTDRRPVPIEIPLGSDVPDREVVPQPLEDYDAK
jgi:transposase